MKQKTARQLFEEARDKLSDADIKRAEAGKYSERYQYAKNLLEQADLENEFNKFAAEAEQEKRKKQVVDKPWLEKVRESEARANEEARQRRNVMLRSQDAAWNKQSMPNRKDSEY